MFEPRSPLGTIQKNNGLCQGIFIIDSDSLLAFPSDATSSQLGRKTLKNRLAETLQMGDAGCSTAK